MGFYLEVERGPADGDTVAVFGEVYEFTSQAPTGKNIPIPIGETAMETATAFAEVVAGDVLPRCKACCRPLDDLDQVVCGDDCWNDFCENGGWWTRPVLEED
jgi:hypothetical protein